MPHSKLLIVEDDVDTRETLAVLLAGQFDCRDAATRDGALKLIKGGFLPSCVLMDYSMPGMSLEAFMRQVKPYNLEVVLTTAHSDSDGIARRVGIKHILIKPMSPDELIGTIKMVVGSGEHAAI